VTARKWICCQIGAREHYAIPRALHRTRALSALLTDAWVNPGNPLGYIKKPIRERYHVELADTTVLSALPGLLIREGMARLKGLDKWDGILARNQWFQRWVISVLQQKMCGRLTATNRPVVFAYSYAALEIFRWAKTKGWKTVLGQIDAGPEMDRIESALDENNPEFRNGRQRPPPEYWNSWREECSLADTIVVNSDWSHRALTKANITPKAIRNVPLSFVRPHESSNFERSYPAEFTSARPLRVLFLGNLTLLKGIASLLEATDLLRDEPIEFRLVGQPHINIPSRYRQNPKIIWEGPVPRGSVSAYYQQADVFIFPTHSDGFGLTQLEAQAWRLPVIASRFCGDVIIDGVNGIRLDEVSGKSIAKALTELCQNPQKLGEMSRHSSASSAFSLENISRLLLELSA
jgi:glycosyltransferase involved in cell wall biosynthesis